MEIAALLIAVAALIVALTRTGSVKPQALDDVKADARRRVENLARELEEQISQTRKLLAEVAAGAQLDEDQILEGRAWRDLPAKQAEQLLASGCHVLDVRTPQETAGGVLPRAVLIPIDQLEDRIAELPKDGKPMLVYCAAGGRSAAACEFLSSQGFAGLCNLEGGMSAWSGPVQRA